MIMLVTCLRDPKSSHDGGSMWLKLVIDYWLYVRPGGGATRRKWEYWMGRMRVV
jgi:hypothetical protein